MEKNRDIYIAVPKGRILEELEPIFTKIGLVPEAAFYDEKSRKLAFETSLSGVKIIRVRSFDVATFVAFGAAQLGVAGNDVIMEFDYKELYAPLDLGIGKCHMALAAPKEYADDKEFRQASHIRVATKYPNITRQFFAARGIQAECIQLHGAMELAPTLGLCRRIVDLVSTGNTLKANGLVELETIMEISSRLIVHRGTFKTRGEEIQALIERFKGATHG